jgi:acyl-CoA thioesterase YciA
MDTAGGALAARVAKGRVATLAITAMTFVEPIKVGDWVSIYGEVSKVGRTSITIALETVVQRRLESTERRVTHGTFVFVAIDDDGKPVRVPRLIPETDEQHARYDRAEAHRLSSRPA